MKELIWNKTLSIEVDEIDEDHRRLVELFNILIRSVSEDDAQDYIEAILEELVACTVWHFRHEERLMLKYRYEGAAEHKAEHAALVDSAKALQQKFLQDGRQLSAADIDFLEHWLTEHILVADMKMGAYLAGVM